MPNKIHEECTEHSGHCKVIKRNKEDVKELFIATDGLKEEMKKLLVKVSLIFGGVVGISQSITIVILLIKL